MLHGSGNQPRCQRNSMHTDFVLDALKQAVYDRKA